MSATITLSVCTNANTESQDGSQTVPVSTSSDSSSYVGDLPYTCITMRYIDTSKQAVPLGHSQARYLVDIAYNAVHFVAISYMFSGK